MAEKSKYEQMVESKEEFLSLAKEIWPHLIEIKGIMEKHGIHGARVSYGTGDYVSFEPYESGWELIRYDVDKAPECRFDLSERIPLEEV